MVTNSKPRAAKQAAKSVASASTKSAGKQPAAPVGLPPPAAKQVSVQRKAKPKVAVAAVAGKAIKPVKRPHKPRPVLVRDSFTMPEGDFALIAKLKATALGAQRAAKKSELLRAGLQVLADMDAESLVLVLDRLETVKTGRPKRAN
jgi:hypothetical protein